MPGKSIFSPIAGRHERNCPAKQVRGQRYLANREGIATLTNKFLNRRIHFGAPPGFLVLDSCTPSIGRP